ncbi:MAG: protecting protein DprA [Solirubrobacterales bacterium]|nr:protecting protein DprA [Solirubrobacterales bacterium]
MTGACPDCIRRCRLLGELGPLLDYETPRRERLLELLALEDEALIEALGGRRRSELRAWYGQPASARMAAPDDGVQLCRHDSRYPEMLRGAASPAVLSGLGGQERLHGLLGRPIVAFLDSREASEYGRAMAASLARGLAAAGVTTLAGLGGPIARAAHEGALQSGASLALSGGGLGMRRTGASGRLARRVLEEGCVISELPWERGGRRWAPLAGERIVAELGTVAVLVESRGEERDLWATRLPRRLAAVPGMITNPLASGPHRLLAAGARLTCDASDLLELLHEAGEPAPTNTSGALTPKLEPRLRHVLDLVGAGLDTAERVSAASPRDRTSEASMPAAKTLSAMAALGELEALGLVARTEQGRYVRLDPAGASFDFRTGQRTGDHLGPLANGSTAASRR